MKTENNSKLLFVGLEGMDWRLIMHYVDQGDMPNLGALINQSSIAKVNSVEPNMANTLWGSMFTGKRPYKHGIIGIKQYDSSLNALLPLSSNLKKSSDLFDIFEFNGKKVQRIGLPLSHPAASKNGTSISRHFTKNDLAFNQEQKVKWPMLTKSVSPKDKAEDLSKLRVHHTEIESDFLNTFIGQRFQADDLLHEKYRIQKMFSDNISLLSSANYLMTNESFDVCCMVFDLIEQICFRYINGGVDYIIESQNELVQMTYQFIDQMIGTLSSTMASDDFLVIASEYGMSSIRVRDKPKTWDKGVEDKSRNNAFFLLKGPSIMKDHIAPDISILDICPTLLTCLKVPVGIDMDGKILPIFSQSTNAYAPPEHWEEKIGKHSLYNSDVHLKDLQSLKANQASIPQGRKNKKNFYFWLAKAYIDDKHFEEAEQILAELVSQYPNEQRFIFYLSRVYDLQSKHAEAQKVLKSFNEDTKYVEAKKLLNKARGLLKYRKNEEGIQQLIKAEVVSDNYPKVLQDIGNIYAKLNKYDDSERLLTKATKLSPLNYKIKTQLARIKLKNSNLHSALEDLNESIALQPFQPNAHFLKGEILTLLKDKQQAAISYENALNQNENHNLARLSLINIYKDREDSSEQYLINRQKFLDSLASQRTIILCASVDIKKRLEDHFDHSTTIIANPKTRGFYQKNQINKLINQAQDKLVITLPRYVFELAPKHKYNILYVKSDLELALALNEKATRENLTKRIEHTQIRLEEWSSQSPHANLTIIEEAKFDISIVDNMINNNKHLIDT